MIDADAEAAQLVAGGAAERVPEAETTVIAGLEVPLLRLNLLEASALAKLDRAVMPRGL